LPVTIVEKIKRLLGHLVNNFASWGEQLWWWKITSSFLNFRKARLRSNYYHKSCGCSNQQLSLVASRFPSQKPERHSDLSGNKENKPFLISPRCFEVYRNILKKGSRFLRAELYPGQPIRWRVLSDLTGSDEIRCVSIRIRSDLIGFDRFW